jgi:hypothetical protein
MLCYAMLNIPVSLFAVGMSHANLEQYMSWVPLVGSGLGSILGGLVSDYVVRFTLSLRAGGCMHLPMVRRIAHSGGFMRSSIENRALLAALSCLVSGPLIMLSIRSGSPNCFVFMVFSGLLGEMYIGIAWHYIYLHYITDIQYSLNTLYN